MEYGIDVLIEWWSVVIPALLLIAHAMAAASAFHALRSVRTSQATVAWVVGLFAMPFVTIPLYWVFARHRFAGYREAIRDVGKRHRASVDAIQREMFTDRNAPTAVGDSPLEQVADVLDTPVCGGNTCRLLIDGEAFFTALIEQIRSAEKYVYAEFYIIRDDEEGRRFADALIERAVAGKKVRLLYDEVGSLRLSAAYLQRLREADVDVRPFNTRQGWVNRFQINFRNHRKLLVVDGRLAIVGGLNIGNEYLGNVKWVSQWRDTAAEVRGAVARKVQAVFAGDYYWAVGQDLPEAEWGSDSPAAGGTPDPRGAGGSAAVFATGPADVRQRATMMFAAAASAARDRL